MLTVKNISALEAEEIQHLKDDEVLISINNPEQPVAKLQIPVDDVRVLVVTFPDIREKVVINNVTYYPLQRSTAKKMVEFIEKYKDKNFIVHCTAGISRSGATALYIHQVYGHELHSAYWYLSDPNPFVLGRLHIARLTPPNVL